MSNSKSNFPNAQQIPVKTGEMGEMVRKELELLSLPMVNTHDVDQIRERINAYFQWCIKNDTRPHVEQLALALGVTRKSLWMWRQENSQRGQLIDAAVQVLASLHEQWGLTGKLNPASFIFLAKNHYGYVDVVNVDQGQPNRLTATKTPEQIAAELEDDIPTN